MHLVSAEGRAPKCRLPGRPRGYSRAMTEKNENFAGVITGTRDGSDDKGKFTIYIIRVSPPWFFGQEPSTVHRRFRDFHKLRSDLGATFGKTTLKGRFQVPKKKAFGKMKPKVVNQRYVELQGFLDEIQADSNVGMHQLVQDFFKVRQDDVPGAARVARDSSVETGHVAQTNAGNVMVAGQRTKGGARAMESAASSSFRPIPSVGNRGTPPKLVAEAPRVTKLDGKRTPTPDKNNSRVSGSPSLGSSTETQTAVGSTIQADSVADPSQNAIGASMRGTSTAVATGPSPPQSPTPAETSDTGANAVRGGVSEGQRAAGGPMVLDSVELPAELQAIIRKAESAVQNGQFGDAAELYTEAIDTLKSRQTTVSLELVSVLNARSKCRLNTGEARKAVEDGTEVLSADPANPIALMQRGQGNEMRERYKDAFLDYLAATKIGTSGAQKRLQQVSKILEQSGESAWVRKQRTA